MPSVSLHIRLAAAAAAAVGVSFLHTFPALAGASAAGVLAAAVFGVFRRPESLRRWAAAQPFLIVLWATVPFSLPAAPAGGLGDACTFALAVTLKCESMLLIVPAMLSEADPGALGAALRRLRVPAGFVFLFVSMYRYADSAGREWRRLSEAAMLRGFRPRTSLASYRTLANMMALTFLYGSDRARRVWDAMRLRGFRGEFRTLDSCRRGRDDLPFLAAALMMSAALAVCEACSEVLW